MPQPLQTLVRTSFLLLSIALLSACSSLSQLVEAPKVSLANVSLLQANLLEQRYRLTLRVQNPNAVAIPISGINYAVKLAGVDFASGLTPNSFNIPANGEDLVTVDVSTNLIDSARQIFNVLRSRPENIDYQLSGDVKVDLPFVKSLPFSRTGQVNLRGLEQQ